MAPARSTNVTRQLQASMLLTGAAMQPQLRAMQVTLLACWPFNFGPDTSRLHSQPRASSSSTSA